MSGRSPLSVIRYVGAATRVVVLSAVRERCGIFVPDTMPGCCAITSFVFQRALRKLGDKSEFVSGYFRRDHKIAPHCWLDVDGRIVDATASQFGVASLVYVPRADSGYLPLLRGARALRKARENHARLGIFDEGDRLAARVIEIAIGERPARTPGRVAA